MKVMVVSYLLSPQLGGGAATSALRLCQGLRNRGIEVIAVTTQKEPQPRLSEEPGFRVYSFRPRNLYWVADKDSQPLPKKLVWQAIDTWNPDVYTTMRTLIRTEAPDVVHVHKLRGLSPAVWSAAAAEQRRPIVQTCRDYELISPEGTLESTVGDLALKRHWSLRPYQALRAQWSTQVDVVTAPSYFTLNTITGMGYFRDSAQLVVPNSHGLSIAELQARQQEPDKPSHSRSGEFRFLYLGRLETVKGIDLLCRAFSDMADEVPCARLDIAGSGSREQELRTTYSYENRIRFHGHVSGETKDRLVADADVLVMPSIVREVFGLSIVESYVYGKPVIAARIGGMPEVVREGETGLLFAPNDEKSLQETMLTFALDPARAHAMAPACLAAAHDYTLEAMTEGYLAAYEAGRG